MFRAFVASRWRGTGYTSARSAGFTHLFGARAIQARYGPSWANASIRVGVTRSVRVAGAAGATARIIPASAVDTSATARPIVILKSLLKLERSRRR